MPCEAGHRLNEASEWESIIMFGYTFPSIWREGDNWYPTECHACTGGFYNPIPGATTCKTCIAGKFSGLKAHECTSCAKGRYNLFDGSYRCLNCTAGLFSAKTNEPCIQCPSGYISKEADVECTGCGEGKTSAYANRLCKNCTAGKVAPVSASPMCLDCSAGKSSNDGAMSCFECEEGTFGPGGAPCQACEPGKHQDEKGGTGCNLCTLGKYSDESGAITCTDCDYNEIGLFEGDSKCYCFSDDCDNNNLKFLSKEEILRKLVPVLSTRPSYIEPFIKILDATCLNSITKTNICL